MSYRFRNSLFGFNKDDVLSFAANSKEKESDLLNKISELEKTVAQLKEDCENKSSELKDISDRYISVNSELEEYKKREESLTKLSESIGRLYLVAQANAGDIVAAAKENAAISSEVTGLNLDLADSAQAEFEDINRILAEKSKEFTDEVNALRKRLDNTKAKIALNNDLIQKNADEAENQIKRIENKVSKC